jgi:long-chain acyl-CoA synthetase
MIGRENLLDLPDFDPSQIATFSYTSGTTGTPKAAMISHANFVSEITIFMHSGQVDLSDADVYLSYLPLPHVMDRLLVIAMSYYGAKVYFYGGDVLKIAEDIKEAKPTIFVSVPRLFGRFYDSIKVD